MKIATMFDVWHESSFNEKDTKSLTDDQKAKLQKVKEVLNKPKKSKMITAWKVWANKHAKDRKLTWEQTL